MDKVQYVVETVLISTHPDIYKAYCYRVEGETREQVHYTPSGYFRYADVEQAAQNMRDDYQAEGSMLKRLYVEHIGLFTEVTSERTDHTTRTLLRDRRNSVVQLWLDRHGYTLVAPFKCATEWPRSHELCGEYTRTIP